MYYIVPRRLKNTVLLLFSLFFYGWGEPKYLLFMLISITQGYVFGRLIEKYRPHKGAKLFLAASVLVCLGLLGVCKYADFLLENFNRVTGLSLPLLKIALPIGISFYTFQILSYTVDVYRGTVKAQRNFINLAMYIAMFPQLIAGPIVRYADIEPQLTSRPPKADAIALGTRRFLLGLAKKVLLANTLGELTAIYKASAEPSVLFAWLYAIAFMLHIYFDFSGYSDMAIGLGHLFGFTFPENFSYPLPVGQHHGILAPVAHFSRHLVPGLCVYPTRWQPGDKTPVAFKPSHRVDGHGAVARGRMDLYSLGAAVCRAAHGRKNVASAGFTEKPGVGAPVCPLLCADRVCAVRCGRFARRFSDIAGHVWRRRMAGGHR